MHSLVVKAVAVIVLVTSVSVCASEMEARIEWSAKKSYVFKTHLKSDDIKIESEDAVVTLTGTVAEDSHKSLAQADRGRTARRQERGQFDFHNEGALELITIELTPFRSWHGKEALWRNP